MDGSSDYAKGEDRKKIKITPYLLASLGEIDDPYEIEFTNYMLALQRKPEASKKEEEPENWFLQMVLSKPLDTRAESEKADSPKVEEDMIKTTAQTKPNLLSEFIKEELYNRFIEDGVQSIEVQVTR